MSKENRHIIDKISAEITGASCDQGSGIDDDVKNALCSALGNIRAVFDRKYNDAYYRFDHLSIELDIKEKDLSQLSAILEDQFVKNIEAAKNIADNNQSLGEYDFKRISAEDRIKELAVSFLKTGQFPWWAAKESIDVIENWMNGISEEEWRDLSNVLFDKRTSALTRLILQFPQKTLDRLIYLSTDESNAESIILLLNEMKQFLDSMGLAFGQSHYIMLKQYSLVFERLLRTKENTNLLSLISTEVVRSAQGMASDSQADFKKSWRKWIEQSEVKQMNDCLEFNCVASEEMTSFNLDGIDRTSDEHFPESVENFDMTISNAGLVLLYPFMQHLFDNLGLLNEGCFESERTRERAVCILHYLATGSDDFAEHELLMSKFLCAYPFDAPVSRFLAISDYEKEECMALIGNVIANWMDMGTFSIGSLGIDFLQRRGVLEKSEGRWVLYVERKPQDRYLDQLPWDVSLLKLDWVGEELITYW